MLHIFIVDRHNYFFTVHAAILPTSMDTKCRVMKSLNNQVQLIGRLGQDPELKTFDSGNTMCRFSLATSDYYTDKNGERQEKTEWHNIVVWGKLA
jgi:hypothetical protein